MIEIDKDSPVNVIGPVYGSGDEIYFYEERMDTIGQNGNDWHHYPITLRQIELKLHNLAPGEKLKMFDLNHKVLGTIGRDDKAFEVPEYTQIEKYSQPVRCRGNLVYFIEVVVPAPRQPYNIKIDDRPAQEPQTLDLRPDYYAIPTSGRLEDAIKDMPVFRGLVAKYIFRAGKKSEETELKDLKKALECLAIEIERLENTAE